jgi:hypothetical protein
MADLLCPEQENENWCMLGKCLKANLCSFKSLSDNVSCVFWCSLSTANVVQLIYVISFVEKVLCISLHNEIISLATKCRPGGPILSLCFGREGFQRSNSWLLITDIVNSVQIMVSYLFVFSCGDSRKNYDSYILCTMFTLESTKRKTWEP